MNDSTIISDPYRSPTTSQRRDDGAVILRGHKTALMLSDPEIDRLVAFVREEPVKARLQRYPVATATA